MVSIPCPGSVAHRGTWPRTICGRSSESFPIVLKTKSCNLLTVPKRSSPRVAIAADLQRKGLGMGPGACDRVVRRRGRGRGRRREERGTRNEGIPR